MEIKWWLGVMVAGLGVGMGNGVRVGEGWRGRWRWVMVRGAKRQAFD